MRFGHKYVVGKTIFSYIRSPIELIYCKTMVNRVLIRLKVVQAVYAYCQGGSENAKSAARELSLSLSSSLELYHILLYLLAEVGRYAKATVSRKSRFSPETLHATEKRFSQNAFLEQLSENVQLASYMESEEKDWITDSGIVKALYGAVLESDVLSDYMTEEKYDYASDKDLVRKLYKSVFAENAQLEEILENQNIYWSSDRELTDSFIIKTIKNFRQENGAQQQLLGQFGDPEDEAFASSLLKASLEGQSEYRAMISLHTRGWDASRLALMDVIVMQVALAEILCIPDVPVKVSINEYVEMAKSFGTQGSGGFVNGVLDTLVHELRENGRLTKN